jgi:hypothetical protein
MQSGSVAERSSGTRSYWPLGLMLLVSLVPLLLATASYFSGVGVPQGRTNRGELVLDRPPLASPQLVDGQGQRWSGNGRWQLLLRVDQCLQPCLKWRHQLGQLIKALGKDSGRVEQQLVVSERASDRQLTSSQLSRLEPGIWLADPLGNLVLRYEFDQPPQALLKDLKRLLRVSKVG